MSTKILDIKENLALQPAYGLWQQYQPENARYAFKAKTLTEAREWQAKTRKALAQTIGLHDVSDSPLRPQLLESVDKGDYTREKVLLQTGEHCLMPVYLLFPKQAQGPLPVVLAFHGHGYGVKDIVGLWEDGEERDTPDGYHKDFAVELCRAGFAVAAPEIACFGERQTDFSYLNPILEQPVPTSCTHAAMLAFHLGTSVLGMRVHDGMRLVDYLETRPELAVGCTPFSRPVSMSVSVPAWSAAIFPLFERAFWQWRTAPAILSPGWVSLVRCTIWPG